MATEKPNMVARVWNAMLRAAPLRVWAMIGAAPVLTALLIWLTWIIWLGGWPLALRGQQLRYIGVLAVIAEILIGVIVTALAAVRVKGQGPGGLQIEVDGGGDAAPKAIVRTETTVEAAKPESKG